MLVLVVLVGWLDYAIGVDLRLYPLYIPPIAIAAWRVGAHAGALVAMGSVGAWVLSHRLAGQDLPIGVWVGNGVAHMAAFATIIGLIESLRRSHAEERRLARMDPLTGLANARFFREMAEVEIERQRRFRRPLTIAYIDLDSFKTVNDRFGHRAGDQVLAAVARALRASTRTTDYLARLGGDEFAVLMPETDARGGRLVLDRVQAGVVQEMAEHGWPVSCSIGAVAFVEAPRDVDELIAQADTLMYQVKQTGKNAIRIERFPAEPNDLIGREPSPESSLQISAVEGG
jgi:diguanylate cyclase (GGDEF)-like protein